MLTLLNLWGLERNCYSMCLIGYSNEVAIVTRKMEQIISGNDPNGIVVEDARNVRPCEGCVAAHHLEGRLYTINFIKCIIM